jgi:hypothetical protein
MLNPFKTFGNILTTLVTFLFLGWYGVFCFRLGWQAHDHPILSSIAPLVMGNPHKPSGKNCHEILGHHFGDCD